MNPTPRNPSVLITLALLLFCLTPAFAQFWDSTYYHTPTRITTEVLQLQTQYPQWVKVDSIGHSNGTHLGHQWPIWSVKLSDNPQVFEDEPVILIIAHIHAEEVIGLEMTMSYIVEMCQQAGRFRDLLQYTQIYVIPTMNPDGLQMIASGRDYEYRKNGYVPPELNGRPCHVQYGAGWDSCGVDLNRNFGFNWVYGETLWTPGSSETFDYYRGPAPFSEPEAQCVRALAEQIKPTLSVVYHGSRQGGNAEKSIVAWNYGNSAEPHNVSPDCTAIGALNMQYCRAENFGITFNAAWGAQRNGNLQDWFYRNLGTFQFNTELGPPRDIQPDSTGLAARILQYKISLKWMHTRLLNLDQTSLTPLTIHTYNAGTNPPQPISCEWRNMNTWTEILEPWYTNAQYGSATLLPMPGPVTIMARKEGFINDTATKWVNPHDYPDSVSLFLQPLPWYDLALHLRNSAGQPIAGRVYLDAEFPHWVDIPTGDATMHLPEGLFRAMAIPSDPSYTVMWRDFYLGGNNTVEFWCPRDSLRLSETFEGDASLSRWNVGGTGNPWRVDTDSSNLHTGAVLATYPEGFRSPYANNLDSWLQYNTPVSLSSGNVAFMKFWRRGRLVIPGDSLFVDVSTDGGSTWERAAWFSDYDIGWTQSYVNLNAWAGSTIRFRFRFKTDPVLGDFGLAIDNVAIYSGVDLDAPQPVQPVAYSYRIHGSYPNPFNPTTTIAYEVANPGAVALVIFNALGQEVRRFDVRASKAGAQHLLWDGTAGGGHPVGSGIYFVQLQAPGTVVTHKMLLLR